MPKTTIYNSSSRGPMVIADMPHAVAKNAVNALKRREPHRTDEIEALDEHLAALKVKYEAELRAEYDTAEAARKVEIGNELTRLAAEA